MKKFTTLLCAVLLAAAMTGCSKKSEDSESSRSYAGSAYTGDDDSFDRDYTYGEPVVENQPELYDTTAISDAYNGGDRDTLSDLDKQIYDKASQVLATETSSDMTLFEKELAVHDWLVENCECDEYDADNLYDGADNPYGPLIAGRSTYLGYTTAFQMFMDMLGIPCKTIQAQNDKDEAHAWNMVCFDNEWYYVDVAFDDSVVYGLVLCR